MYYILCIPCDGLCNNIHLCKKNIHKIVQQMKNDDINCGISSNIYYHAVDFQVVSLLKLNHACCVNKLRLIPV